MNSDDCRILCDEMGLGLMRRKPLITKDAKEHEGKLGKISGNSSCTFVPLWLSRATLSLEQEAKTCFEHRARSDLRISDELWHQAQDKHRTSRICDNEYERSGCTAICEALEEKHGTPWPRISTRVPVRRARQPHPHPARAPARLVAHSRKRRERCPARLDLVHAFREWLGQNRSVDWRIEIYLRDRA